MLLQGHQHFGLLALSMLFVGFIPGQAFLYPASVPPVPPPPPKPLIVFDDVAEQSRQFIRYYVDIHLTPAQQEIMDVALKSERAVCCDDHPMADCCCVCNLSRTVWGLAKHLIADFRLDAAETRRVVKEWLTFVNPNGFSGETCYLQRCNEAYGQDGCGGMDASHVIAP